MTMVEAARIPRRSSSRWIQGTQVWDFSSTLSMIARYDATGPR